MQDERLSLACSSRGKKKNWISSHASNKWQKNAYTPNCINSESKHTHVMAIATCTWVPWQN